MRKYTFLTMEEPRFFMLMVCSNHPILQQGEDGGGQSVSFGNVRVHLKRT